MSIRCWLLPESSDIDQIVCKHKAQRLTYWGWPALVFAQDRRHVLFRSDVTGKPQIYMATIPPDLDRRLQPPPQPAASSPGQH